MKASPAPVVSVGVTSNGAITCIFSALASNEPRGDRLIGGFAAKAQVKILSENGLARARKGVREGGEIGIRATDDRDARRLGHERSFAGTSRETHRFEMSKRMPVEIPGVND